MPLDGEELSIQRRTKLEMIGRIQAAVTILGDVHQKLRAINRVSTNCIGSQMRPKGGADDKG